MITDFAPIFHTISNYLPPQRRTKGNFLLFKDLDLTLECHQVKSMPANSHNFPDLQGKSHAPCYHLIKIAIKLSSILLVFAVTICVFFTFYTKLSMISYKHPI